MVQDLGFTMKFALCPCDAQFNQNSYVIFFLIYLKLNNRIDNKNK